MNIQLLQLVTLKTTGFNQHEAIDTIPKEPNFLWTQ